MKTQRSLILCVEKNSDTCVLLNFMLGRETNEVTCVSTVAEGLRLARAQQYDLYLLDGLLEDGTGVELCEQLRQFDSRTPVVFFSALAQEADRHRAYEAGAQSYLVKPNDLDLLAATVARLLARAKVAALA